MYNLIFMKLLSNDIVNPMHCSARYHLVQDTALRTSESISHLQFLQMIITVFKAKSMGSVKK